MTRNGHMRLTLRDLDNEHQKALKAARRAVTPEARQIVINRINRIRRAYIVLRDVSL